jgi:hypothetical protein
MSGWNRWTENVLSDVSRGLKRRRVEMFVQMLGLGERDQILDLGSEDGSYLASFYPYPRNIVLADINEAPMARGVAWYGLKGYIVIPSDGPLPIGSRQFDAVWCNSVIEHVTLNRGELGRVARNEFRRRSEAHQKFFARELARVARQYFVQTPYLHFPIEAHSWLPLVQYLPQERRWPLARTLKKVWIKQWQAGFHLYDRSRFREHFPDMTALYIERVLGVPKSLIAIRCEQREPERVTLTSREAMARGGAESNPLLAT